MWIESHQNLARHPKLLKLVALSKQTRAACIGHVHLLWWWALEYAPDGDLSKFSKNEVLEAIDGGHAWLFVEHMIACGFIDADMKIHNWNKYAGRLLEGMERKRALNRERQQRYRENKKPDTDNALRNAPVTLSNGPTLPDLTKPNQTNKKPCAEPEKAPAAAPTSPVLLEFPVVGNGGTTWPFTEAHCQELKSAFHSADVLGEARKALVWVKANPTKRKTRGGMPKFLYGWLKRSNNQGGYACGHQAPLDPARIRGGETKYASLGRRAGPGKSA